MATLAQHLQNKGIRLVDPFQEHKQHQAEAVAEEAYESEELLESEEESEEEMPPSTPKTPRHGNKSPGAVLSSKMKAMKIDQPPQLSGCQGSLARPMLPSRWEDFNFDTDCNSAYCKIVLFVDNTTEKGDFDVSWIDERHFKIRVKWPEYMQKCMMMSGLDANFPKGHPSYTEMGKNAKKLKDRNGVIWDEGIFYFYNDMNTSVYHATILKGTETNPDDSVVKVRFLQIIFEESVEEDDAPAAALDINEIEGTFACKSAQRTPAQAASPPTGMEVDTPPPSPPSTGTSVVIRRTTTAVGDPLRTPLPDSPRTHARDEFVAPRSGKKAKTNNAAAVLAVLPP